MATLNPMLVENFFLLIIYEILLFLNNKAVNSKMLTNIMPNYVTISYNEKVIST